jgi:hypothetical protein
MPVDRMMTFYPLADTINCAVADSNSVTTIKPLLLTRQPHDDAERHRHGREDP